MKYVLDTNAVSALMRSVSVVRARLHRVDPSQVCVPQPVMSELVYGIERLPPSKRRTELEGKLEVIRTTLVRAPWTDAVSERFGTIKATLERKGTRIEDFDAAIAAHALAEGAVLVTANVAHMARVPGLTVEDWAAE